MTRLTETQKDDIVKRYQAGERSKDIAAIYGIRDNSIAGVLRKRGIERTKIQRLPQEDLDKAVKMYVEDKVSSEIIAKHFGVDTGVIRRAIKKSGAEMRLSTENKRQYKIDDAFFEKIDKETNAYFLGFLYADGNLGGRKGSGAITITLHPQDRDILERFSNLIYGFHKLTDDYQINTGRTYTSIRIYSQKMHGDLIKLGCTPKKSFTIQFPSIDIVPDHLMHHFIRGFMDGDGCICITDKTRPRVDFTSALPFLEGLADYLNKNVGLQITRFDGRHPDRETNTRNIQIMGFDDVRKLLDYLYKDATTFISRKYDKYIEMIAQQSSHKSKKEEKYKDPSKYGTTYIYECDGVLPTTKILSAMSKEDKNKLIEPLFSFYRTNGFPNVVASDDELIKKFAQLKTTNTNIENNILLANNSDSNMIFKHFSNHFYEVKSGNKTRPSVMEAFYDDKLLKEIIKNRLYGNYNINGDALRRGLINSKLACRPSIFNSAMAFSLYNLFIQDGDTIYDYSMGFGQRLSAALSLPYKIHYVGTDPFDKSVNSNVAIYDFCKKYGITNSTVDLRCIGSEDFIDEKYIGKVNLALSSPPYYDLEIYEDNDKQATSLSYADFLDKYWRQTVSNIEKMLTKNGRFVINIIDDVGNFHIGENMTNIIKEFGFELEDTYYIQLSRNLVFGGNKVKHKLEPIYVFKRIGSPPRILTKKDSTNIERSNISVDCNNINIDSNDYSYINKHSILGMSSKSYTNGDGWIKKNKNSITIFYPFTKEQITAYQEPNINISYLSENQYKDFLLFDLPHSKSKKEMIVSNIDEDFLNLSGGKWKEIRAAKNKYKNVVIETSPNNMDEINALIDKWDVLRDKKYGGWQNHSGYDRAFFNLHWENEKENLYSYFFYIGDKLVGYSIISKIGDKCHSYIIRKNDTSFRNLCLYIDYKTFRLIFDDKKKSFLINWGASDGGVKTYKEKFPLYKKIPMYFVKLNDKV